jgi:adenylate kinase
MNEEMNEAIDTIIILGAPGSGKDTQANFLVDALGYKVISTGDLVRILAGHNDEVNEMMKKGELIPDNIVEDELISTFVLLPDEQPIIIDGYPRTIEQAQKLDTILEENQRGLDKVIYIKISDQESIKRLSTRKYCADCGHTTYATELVCPDCGGKLSVRDDDKVESIKHRLELFHKKTEPIINYYKEKGLLVEVDGTPDPIKVKESVREVL